MQQKQIGTNVRYLFDVILSWEYVYDILLIIQRHFQGQKIDLKVKFEKIWFVKHTSRNKRNNNNDNNNNIHLYGAIFNLKLLFGATDHFD